MFINKKELDNKLDFFDNFRVPHKKSPTKWLTISGILLVSQILLLNKYFQTKQKQLKTIKLDIQKIATKLEPLKKEIAKTNETKTQNLLVKNKIKKYNSGLDANKQSYTILTNIAEQIPDECRLTKLIIKKTKNSGNDNKKPKTIVSLYGESLNQKLITNFTQNLRKFDNLTKTKILRIQRVKNKDQIIKYIFKLKSQIKDI